MEMCNNHNKLDYEVAPTLFLEFHGTPESVESQAKSVGNYNTTKSNDKQIFISFVCELVLFQEK